jgi:DNA-binding response OmpR family regulator
MKILVIDDQPMVLTTLHASLRCQGREIVTCLNPLKGLTLCLENRFDLVILDIDMPGMSGLELCRNLKACPATEKIPLVFVSGRDDEASRAEATRWGALGYLLKPFDVEELRNYFVALLKNSQFERENLR